MVLPQSLRLMVPRSAVSPVRVVLEGLYDKVVKVACKNTVRYVRGRTLQLGIWIIR